jgi:hypothetical protein
VLFAFENDAPICEAAEARGIWLAAADGGSQYFIRLMLTSGEAVGKYDHATPSPNSNSFTNVMQLSYNSPYSASTGSTVTGGTTCPFSIAQSVDVSGIQARQPKICSGPDRETQDQPALPPRSRHRCCWFNGPERPTGGPSSLTSSHYKQGKKW